MKHEQEKAMNLDACIKCSTCTAMCPVATVQPLYLGPKYMGPDAERFRLEGVKMGTSILNHCSGCRTCDVTCPSGVKITEIISKAKKDAKLSRSQKSNQKLQLKIRDYFLGRAEYMGKLATIMPTLTNSVLKTSAGRKTLEKMLRISSKAPLPAYTPKLKVRMKTSKTNKQVIYFPGCFTKYNDFLTGQAIIKVLEHNGYEVIVPPFSCCGTPLLGNALFNEAKKNEEKNSALMKPFFQAGIPLVTGCTSCSLSLKEYKTLKKHSKTPHEFRIYDLFEFLWKLYEQDELRIDFQEVKTSLGYHAPCHLKPQGIGSPSIRLLQLIKGIKIIDLDLGCCGLSGSYGFKEEKYEVAMRVGSPLFTGIRQGVASNEFYSVITECGGCQVQIRHGSTIEAKHPIWIMMESYGLELKARKAV